MSAGTTVVSYCTFSRAGCVGAACLPTGLSPFGCFACFFSFAAGFASWAGALPAGFASFLPFASLSSLAMSTSSVHDFAVGLEETNLASGVAALGFEEPEAHAVALPGRRVDEHHVGDRHRHLLFDDPAGLVLHGVGPLVLLHAVHALDQHLAALEHAQDRPALALFPAGGDDHLVAFASLVHVRLLEDFRGQRHDLHEPLRAELPRDGPEDARADRLELGVQQHRGIGVELDHRAVGAADAVRRAHHDRAVDLALLHAAARRGAFHAHLDDVPDARIATLGAAQHLDTHHRARAGVVGDVENGLHLNHFSLSNLTRAAPRQSWIRLPPPRRPEGTA